MNSWICRCFIPDHTNTADATVRERHGVLSSVVGIVANLVLFALKMTVGLISGSIAILADAINNVSDAGTSIVSFVTFRIAAKPADRDHPFGHARIEYISSMIVSFLILFFGFELMMDSVGRLFSTESGQVDVSPFTVLILAVSVLIKLWLGFFYRYVGRTIDSSVVRAASVDSFSDCVSTTVLLISSVVMYVTDVYMLDAILGVGVSALIMLAGVRILNETKNSLLGEAPVEETVRSIEQIISRFPEAIGVHDMLVHNYGPHHSFASLHIEVDGSGDIYHLHDTIDNIERAIGEELGILCTVHMDPIETHDAAVNELRSFVTETVYQLDPTLSVHDVRAVIGHTHTNLIFDVILPFESKKTPEQIRERISAAIIERRPNHYCVITVDRA